MRKEHEYSGALQVLQRTYYPDFQWKTKQSKSNERTSSAQLGTEFDADCTRMVNGHDPMDEFGIAAQEWMLRQGWTPVRTQIRCFDARINVSSRADMFVKDKEGRNIHVEWKTGYPESTYELSTEKLRLSYSHVDSCFLTHHEMQARLNQEMHERQDPKFKIYASVVLVNSGFDKNTGEPLIRDYWVRPWVFGILEKLVKDAKEASLAKKAKDKEAKDKARKEKAAVKKQVAFLKKSVTKLEKQVDKMTKAANATSKKGITSAKVRKPSKAQRTQRRS